LLTRRLPTFAVTVVSQAAGFVLLLAIVAVRAAVSYHSFPITLLPPLGGAVAAAAVATALSLGTMSILAPRRVRRGRAVRDPRSRPAQASLAGRGVASCGRVGARYWRRSRSAVGSPERGRAIALAVVAAVALGLFVYFLGLGSRQGDALSTLVGARVGSLGLLIVLALLLRAPLRVPRASLAAVAAVGIADVTANALFALASRHGLLAIVSVLGSLYPVVTVLLAHVFLHERLTRLQQAGVVAAVAGVAAIAGG
jgi:drug/metabolite transporter (DMT)-like permease